MRRFLLILFVLVLPLRAVAGDLMALAMATMPADMPATEAPAMAPDCGMHHAAPADHDSQGDADQTHYECCALCLPVAQLAAAAPLQRQDVAEAVPAASDASFLSAVLGRNLRPPSL